MKAAPIIVNWHAENAPIYSADFQPHGKGRLATAGGDNNVRLWRLEADGEDRKVEYLCTMSRHSQAVNVVRWAPRGDVLASAGDDGNVITWVIDTKNSKPTLGDDGVEDKESWRTKQMCRSSGAEIYDLAWSPDGVYFITGSMDNIARIYNAQTGHMIRNIAEHQHYVQGVAWDPLNEFIATQSSDRSVHIYSLKTKDGTFTLDDRDSREESLRRVGMNLKMDLPGRRISSNSPAPPDMNFRSQPSKDISTDAIGSPVPSCPGTPTSLALPMNPPSTISHSRRSSFGAASSTMSMRRSVSPAPSLPLPAVMPMEASPKPYSNVGLGVKNANIYANDTLKSFFRRLTFTPDGSLLFTPAGQYQNQQKGPEEGVKASYEVMNTVYIYSRGGINKPPVAHLPGHKKPSVVVKCSPIYYTPRKVTPPTKRITIDTSSEDMMPALPEPAIPKSPTHSIMEPPPIVPPQSDPLSPKSKAPELDTSASTPGPTMAFFLPYRMVYAVATEDAVLLYDTQQQTPLCVVSNLHCATFTDLTWSTDGQTLLMTSSDGFCSTLTFAPGELGEKYTGETSSIKHPTPTTTASSSQNTPMATPSSIAPPSPFHHHRTTSNPRVPSPPPRQTSPTRSNSTSSIATQSSYAPGTVISNPLLVQGSMPGVIPGLAAGIGIGFMTQTPPQTPRSTAGSVSGVKRDASESEREDGGSQAGERKRRRVAPTPVGDAPNSGSGV